MGYEVSANTLYQYRLHDLGVNFSGVILMLIKRNYALAMYEDEQIWGPITTKKFRVVKIYVETMVVLPFIMPFTSQGAHCPECRAVSHLAFHHAPLVRITAQPHTKYKVFLSLTQ